jgi:DNA-binding NarL/FixJ family response regulator
VTKRFSLILVGEPNQFLAVGVQALLQQHPSVGFVKAVSSHDAVHEQLSMSQRFDVLLIDDALLAGDGYAAVAELVNRHPGLSLIVMVDRAERSQIFGYLASGAQGCIYKSATQADLSTAVSVVLSGRTFVPSTFFEPCKAANTNNEAGSHVTTLTTRQDEIMRLVASGQSNKEIARKLGIAEATVKVHLGIVFKRFGVHNRTGAVAQVQSLQAVA